MKYLLMIMGVFKITDGIITHFFVGDGLVREANSLMVPVIQGGDFLLLKVIGAFCCVLILWRLYKRYPRLAVSTTSSIVVFYAAVTAWNTSVFLNI